MSREESEMGGVHLATGKWFSWREVITSRLSRSIFLGSTGTEDGI